MGGSGGGWYSTQYRYLVPGTGTVLVWLVAGCTEIIEKSLPAVVVGISNLKTASSRETQNLHGVLVPTVSSQYMAPFQYHSSCWKRISALLALE